MNSTGRLKCATCAPFLPQPGLPRWMSEPDTPGYRLILDDCGLIVSACFVLKHSAQLLCLTAIKIVTFIGCACQLQQAPALL